MKRAWAIFLCMCVCTCYMPVLVGAEDTPSRGVPRAARNKTTSVLEENIRVVLLIQRRDTEPLSMSVVTARGRVTMDEHAGVVEIGGNEVPIILRFEATLEPLGDGEYLVSCTYGTSTPVVTSSSTTKEGVPRSSFQYRDMGVEASARMTMGRPITILQDPDKEVSLELQSVNE